MHSATYKLIFALTDFSERLRTHMQRYWAAYLFGPACLIASIQWVGIYYGIYVNISPSLPNAIFIVHKGEPVTRGDHIVFKWRGGGPYDAGTPFCKIVAGVKGDVVERQGRAFYINSKFVGNAKPISSEGKPLELAGVGIIGTNEYYVMAPHPDSLDSRYKLTGWVKQDAIIGRAYPLF